MSAQRTIYAAHLSTCKTRGKPFSVIPNSTLNQKFNLHVDERPGPSEYPTVSYLGIGNKGVSYELTGTGHVLLKTEEHLPHHAALYNHIPFVARRIVDDLPAEERSKYRLRVPATIGGIEYVLYYLRVIENNNATPVVELRSVNGSVVDTTTFVPEASALSPVHVPVSDTTVNTVASDYLTSSDKVNIVLSRSDVINIREACTLLYGDPRYAFINEACVVSGVDRVLQGNFGAAVSNYLEVVSAQVNSFLYPRYDLTETTTEVIMRLDIGSSEPLYLA